MTQIKGNFGVGVSGKLWIKPSASFVGGLEGWNSYPVINGEVDFNLAPTPRGVVYLVDFQSDGSFSNPSAMERWSIPNAPVLSLEELRFPVKRTATPLTINPLLSQVEVTSLRQEKSELEKTINQLGKQVEESYHREREHRAIIESLRAEVAGLQTNIYLSQIPQERVIEREVRVPVVERSGDVELLREIERIQILRIDLLAENERLRAILEKAVLPPFTEPVIEYPDPRCSLNADIAESLDLVLDLLDRAVSPPLTEPQLSPDASIVETLDFLLKNRRGNV